MEMLGEAMHDFNAYAKSNPRLHPYILPIRDGLSIIQFQSIPEDINMNIA